MTKPQIESFARDAKSLEVAHALRRDGAVIVREVLPHGVVEELVQAAEPLLHDAPGTEFYGGNVRTCGNLFGKDPVFATHLLTNPLILDVLDGTLLPEYPLGSQAKEQRLHGEDGYDQNLGNGDRQRDDVNGPNCHHYRVHFSGSIQVGPGGGKQELHREMDIFRPYIEQDPAQPDWVVAVNYAGVDFTEDNGATRIVPGSHRWPAERAPHRSEEAQAVMPKGSALFWLGKSFHALGTNHTPDLIRAGLLTIFSVNWLTQEENQFIAVPPDFVEQLPEKAQQLLGYRGASVGWVNGRDSENLLREGVGQPI